MDDAAIDEFADRLFDLLAAEDRLNPISDHPLEIMSAGMQLIVGVVMNASDDPGYQKYLCEIVADTAAKLPHKLQLIKPPSQAWLH